MIKADTNPRMVHEESLRKADAADREKQRRGVAGTETIEKVADNNPTLRDFLQAFRALTLVGQIIKNNKGSIKKQKLKDMLEELYLGGFRSAGFFSSVIEQFRSDITDEMVDRVKDELEKKAKGRDYILEKGMTDDEVKELIQQFINHLHVNMYVSVFSKIINSVGTNDLKELYSDVATKIGTPAAKLVTFSIDSYFGKVTSREIKELAEELKGNPVALYILKARVRSYIYQNPMSREEKQRIAQILGLTFAPK